MKTLTDEEFKGRMLAIAKAKRIFTPHLTRNITTAFEIYQELLAKEKRDVLINKYQDRLNIFHKLMGKQLPRCPECGEKLFLRVVMEGGKCPQTLKRVSKKANRFGWRTCWECRSPTCYYERYSKKEFGEWMMKLKKRIERRK